MRSTYPINLQVIGVNHDTAPIHVREQLSLAGEHLSYAYKAVSERVMGRPQANCECVILSTCNRFEVYLLLPNEQPEHEPLLMVLSDLFGCNVAHLQKYIYHHNGPSAVRHLLRVTSGIDSLIPGEVQILGQVQRAWQASHTEDAVGPVMSQLFHRAVALGKRVHSETDISRRPASVSYAAVVLARQVLGAQLETRRVLVIGSGEVGEGVARCLHDHGLHATVVAHRQLDRARSVARRYDAEVASWDDLPRQLASADVVITSTSAPHTVLQREHIEEAVSLRSDRPLYLIDLAVPRDIDPSAADLPGVHLHNIDDLHAVVRTTMEERRSALPQIERMVQAEVGEFTRWLTARMAFPTIKTLREQADVVAERELQWALAKMPDLSPRERQVVEAMTARITGKLLHGPIQWLKTQAERTIEPDYGLSALDEKQINNLFFSGATMLDGMGDDERGQENPEA